VATIELADPAYAEYIDEVEVGRRVAGHVRLAFEVEDARAVTTSLAEAGAEVIARRPARRGTRSTPAWRRRPALQVTIFAELRETRPTHLSENRPQPG